MTISENMAGEFRQFLKANADGGSLFDLAFDFAMNYEAADTPKELATARLRFGDDSAEATEETRECAYALLAAVGSPFKHDR